MLTYFFIFAIGFPFLYSYLTLNFLSTQPDTLNQLNFGLIIGVLLWIAIRTGDSSGRY
ncbi:MAG: hypothetical protein KGZ79_16505 [Dethiobacter sp.]|nr:hypothetical protein [Dethiobacter sp.]MBS4023993.1 hypothetical protein [Dethiobacter sp.]